MSIIPFPTWQTTDPDPKKEVSCSDGCGNKAAISVTLECPPSWQYLELTKRLRCPDCQRALLRVNTKEQTDVS